MPDQFITAAPELPSLPGAQVVAGGTAFAVPSMRADQVELCLYDEHGTGEQRLDMQRNAHGLWQRFVPGLGAGALYGFRAHGPWSPQLGHRFNPAKLQLDPYARAVSGVIPWHPSLCDHRPFEPDQPDDADSAPHLPRSVVVDDQFDWGDDAILRTPAERTFIYECHVRGMTMRHPQVPAEHRGTFLGLVAPPVLDHLHALGVTAVELMPVMQSADNARLSALGLTNYWGYATAAFFAPDARFATAARGGQVREFREMVRRFHQAGIEVILDVVYNHTAEEGVDGPTLCFRGLDNAAWYVADPHDPGRYLDVTGCGHTLDVVSEPGRSLLFDSLRYWAQDMHVDGFRFDLAPALARGGAFRETLPRLFQALRDEPALAGRKLIAEPWDVAPDGYQLGRFPRGWSEWNDRYRDTVRRFWNGLSGEAGSMATAVAGSSDLFERDGRGPDASVNFVTCHDGFTLADLVSYRERHNEANGEGNRDGTGSNWSRNWGVEGESTAPSILALRDRASRAMLATLMISQGIPMLGHGDEMLRTQQGNNNAYGHDGPLTWVNWNLDERARSMLDFTVRAAALRRRHPVLRRCEFLAPSPESAGTVALWFNARGASLTGDEWLDPAGRALGLRLVEHGSDALVILCNGGTVPISFVLPPGRWQIALASGGDGPATGVENHCVVPATSLTVLEPASAGRYMAPSGPTMMNATVEPATK